MPENEPKDIFIGKNRGGAGQIHEKFQYFLRGFTFAVSETKEQKQRSGRKINYFHESPGWRNWQTQRTQNPPVLSTLGVRLPLPAPALSFVF
jgi:hypothetical protein